MQGLVSLAVRVQQRERGAGRGTQDDESSARRDTRRAVHTRAPLHTILVPEGEMEDDSFTLHVKTLDGRTHALSVSKNVRTALKRCSRARRCQRFISFCLLAIVASARIITLNCCSYEFAYS